MEMFLIAGDFVMFTNFNNPTEKAGICVNDENERTFKEFLHIQQQE